VGPARAAAVPTLGALTACGGRQSALRPEGPEAAAILDLTLLMTVAATVILIVVCVLALLAYLAPHIAGRVPGRGLVIGGGVAFPTIALTLFLFYELGVLLRVNRALPDEALRIEVIGRQFWWEIRYRQQDGALDFVTANEVVLPAHSAAEVLLVGADVIHSFWIPSLTGKMDLIPGRTNRLSLLTADPVVLRGQCAEYCGAQHALMAFDVEVLAPEAFEGWRERQRTPAQEPVVDLVAEGRAAFLASGCSACHTVRGTPADGGIGPDLTHVGSRRSLAAGSFPNNIGTLAGWISDSQHLKPGNAMPSFDTLDGRTVRSIATWLASLR
jgi:cytochrome c oxidase subunit II